MSNENKDKTQQELNKAINFLGQNKFSEAESICEEIIKVTPNSDAYHILSSIKLYNQDFDESIKLVDESIKLNNKNPGYYVTLGCAYSASKEYFKSVEAFKGAISLNDKIAQVHFYLGESYRKLKKYNDAISSFYKTIEVSPDHVIY
jgi:tetratricopeptide (TPR) repeat protein